MPSTRATRRRAARLATLLLLLGSLIPVSAARAAQFTLTPGQPVYTSGAGPFDWSFQSSSDPNGENGWVGYKFSTEATWHRCLQSHSVTLASLPDGTYSIQIADDLNENWLNEMGLLYSGANTCGSASTPPPGAVSQDTITVVSTTLTVGPPPTVTLQAPQPVPQLAPQPVPQLAPTGTPHPVRCVVPNLKNRTLARAETRLAEAHCKLGQVTHRKKHKRHVHITSQRASAGTTLAAGTKVRVTLG